ncbi:hypothetical protein A2954_04665 [Candidatus Roizmanbacteria bacterium RIFCSPLOWO2_01_FULL_37_12]|uniref:Fibronectin type-III domain-containing protein n=1 Tax=Candidatus Roizmanbacteria bacterium RIFCSPLOWO2_01_FULL_37_12 TaxID=1802056 RepID=A0A1F7IFX8_9BACT|nr:MAG: hypothetical protein A3D76_06125 [Candidatus Roizmanbacteria bacterium RIFCSPHIGHO2_02_FULL_37_9b]OGK42274.1 MAG: hypothetical protein A2954_04665 [Candidatus Roizmanbacteria bacterium RIFCSPLOWO2_01_FULL_37_12]
MHFPKTPALITGIVLAFVMLIGGFMLVQLLPGRAADQQPRDVVVSDITTNSAKINFATGSKTQGVVEYGLTPTSLNLLAPESESDTSHELELTLLSEGTTYYFQITIGGKKFDNAGVPWTFSTKTSESLDSGKVSPSPIKTPTSAVRVLISDGPSPCEETVCEKIKLKLGKGCTTQDYMKCLKKNPPTQKPLTTP